MFHSTKDRPLILRGTSKTSCGILDSKATTTNDHNLGGLKQTYSITISKLEIRSQGVSKGEFLLESPREKLFLVSCLAWLLVAAGNPWCSLVHRCTKSILCLRSHITFFLGSIHQISPSFLL